MFWWRSKYFRSYSKEKSQNAQSRSNLRRYLFLVRVIGNTTFYHSAGVIIDAHDPIQFNPLVITLIPIFVVNSEYKAV